MQIFQTKNQALAVTLATCGVPFATAADPQGKQVPFPFVHFYDADILRRLGFRGLKLADAALQAWNQGRPGVLVYNFQRTPVLERILKAYDGMSAAITKADATGVPAPCVIDIEPEDAAKLCCQFVKNRKMFNEGWRTATPYIAAHGGIRTETEDGAIYKIGSFKLISLKAGADTRKQIGM